MGQPSLAGGSEFRGRLGYNPIMAGSAVVRSRVSVEVKEQATSVLEGMGASVSDADAHRAQPDMKKLKDLLSLLIADEPLPPRYKGHSLGQN